VVLLGNKSRCTIFSPKKKEQKTAVVSCLNLFQTKTSQDSMQREHSAESIAVGESLSGRLKLVELSRWVLQYRLEPANLLDIVVSIG